MRFYDYIFIFGLSPYFSIFISSLHSYVDSLEYYFQCVVLHARKIVFLYYIFDILLMYIFPFCDG